MRTLPPLAETELDREAARPYAGPIEVDQVFAWEPDLPHARCLCIVSRVGGNPPPPIVVKHATGTAIIGNGSGPFVWTYDFPDRMREVYNDESRFREAVIPTRLRVQS